MTEEAGYAVWLYGSRARGTGDDFSDTDVLLVSDGDVDEASARVHFHGARAVAVSEYSWSEMEEMAAYGSLFLHHLRLEGCPVFESRTAQGRLGDILAHVGPYQRAAWDVTGFRTVLADIRASIGDGFASITFELATLGTVFRHASILGCALACRSCFSRNGPIETLVEEWGLPVEWAREFPELYQYRLQWDGRAGQVKRHNANTFVATWLRRADALVNTLAEYIDDQDSALLDRDKSCAERGAGGGAALCRTFALRQAYHVGSDVGSGHTQ